MASQPQPGGWNRFVLEVPDIDAAVRDLSAKGGRFRSEPIQGPGGRRVLCEDPLRQPNRVVRSEAVMLSNLSFESRRSTSAAQLRR